MLLDTTYLYHTNYCFSFTIFNSPVLTTVQCAPPPAGTPLFTVYVVYRVQLERSYKDSDLGGDPMEDVGGRLLEEAPQFLSAAGSHATRRCNETVSLLSTYTETNEEALTRRAAIEFSKNWQDTKAEMVEVRESSMKHDTLKI